MQTKTVQEINDERYMENYLKHKNAGKITLEKNLAPRITKSAGYIPIEQQIRMQQEAGRTLEMLRAGEYDFQDGNYGFKTDPTRKLSFDLADASEMQRGVGRRLSEAKIREAERQKNQEKTPAETPAKKEETA
jgi:hypothetical protein